MKNNVVLKIHLPKLVYSPENRSFNKNVWVLRAQNVSVNNFICFFNNYA